MGLPVVGLGSVRRRGMKGFYGWDSGRGEKEMMANSERMRENEKGTMNIVPVPALAIWTSCRVVLVSCFFGPGPCRPIVPDPFGHLYRRLLANDALWSP